MTELEALKNECEQDLFTFAKMMYPNRYFGDLHRDMFRFFQESLERAMKTGEGAADGALVPRDHQKSFCIAVTTAWAITKYPWFTVAYVSSNPTLSERQLTIIKNLFMSEEYRALWPEMLNFEMGRTGKMEHKPTGAWTKTEISVDHPERPKSEKDPTIVATSAKSTNTGAHVKLIVFDDLVTNENYESATERQAVKNVYQSFSSIATTGSIMWAVGTRYGDNDLYSDLQKIEYDVYDDKGQIIESKNYWNFFERVVEDSKNRDGTGTYCWPRQKWGDGWYGFDATELSKKRANAFNLELFYAQYYNDPNAVATDRISTNNFMYIDQGKLEQINGQWWYDKKQLKLFCGVDLAFTEGNAHQRVRRDSTAMAVIAWDQDGYLYVLDVLRFQTDKVEVYYQNLIELYDYWGFRECAIETNVGGKVVLNFIQDEVRKDGRALVINGVSFNHTSGSKQERIRMTTETLYRQNSVYHTKGKYTRELEEELRLAKPPHDDLKDALTIAIANSKRPGNSFINSNVRENAMRQRGNVVNASGRFYKRRRRA